MTMNKALVFSIMAVILVFTILPLTLAAENETGVDLDDGSNPTSAWIQNFWNDTIKPIFSIKLFDLWSFEIQLWHILVLLAGIRIWLWFR